MEKYTSTHSKTTLNIGIPVSDISLGVSEITDIIYNLVNSQDSTSDFMGCQIGFSSSYNESKKTGEISVEFLDSSLSCESAPNFLLYKISSIHDDLTGEILSIESAFPKAKDNLEKAIKSVMPEKWIGSDSLIEYLHSEYERNILKD